MEYEIELIPLAVTDVDRAIEFYGTKIGWSVDFDQVVREGLRFVQVTPQGSPVLDGSRGRAWDVRNTGGRRSRYLAYAGAIVYRGDWSATTCVPERERVSGTVVVIGRVRAGVVRCHGRPTNDRLRRAAELTACHHDSTAARPFRLPSG